MVGRDHPHISYNFLIYLARQQTSIKYVKMAFLLSFSTFWTQSAALNMPTYLENSAVATGLEKVSFHSNPKERQWKRMLKLLHSHTSKVMLKILQVKLQQYMNHEFPDVYAGFRKGRGIRGQIANQKTSTSALLTTPMPLTVWITTNYGKFLKRWEYQTTLPAS